MSSYETLELLTFCKSNKKTLCTFKHTQAFWVFSTAVLGNKKELKGLLSTPSCLLFNMLLCMAWHAWQLPGSFHLTTFTEVIVFKVLCKTELWNTSCFFNLLYIYREDWEREKFHPPWSCTNMELFCGSESQSCAIRRAIGHRGVDVEGILLMEHRNRERTWGWGGIALRSGNYDTL